MQNIFFSKNTYCTANNLAKLLSYTIMQGFPTLINGGPHTCQSGFKVGRIKQN